MSCFWWLNTFRNRMRYGFIVFMIKHSQALFVLTTSFRKQIVCGNRRKVRCRSILKMDILQRLTLVILGLLMTLQPKNLRSALATAIVALVSLGYIVSQTKCGNLNRNRVRSQFRGQLFRKNWAVIILLMRCLNFHRLIISTDRSVGAREHYKGRMVNYTGIMTKQTVTHSQCMLHWTHLIIKDLCRRHTGNKRVKRTKAMRIKLLKIWSSCHTMSNYNFKHRWLSLSQKVKIVQHQDEKNVHLMKATALWLDNYQNRLRLRRTTVDSKLLKCHQRSNLIRMTNRIICCSWEHADLTGVLLQGLVR